MSLGGENQLIDILPRSDWVRRKTEPDSCLWEELCTEYSVLENVSRFFWSGDAVAGDAAVTTVPWVA